MEDIYLNLTTTKAILWQEKKRWEKIVLMIYMEWLANCQQFGGKFMVLSYIRAKCDLFSTSEQQLLFNKHVINRYKMKKNGRPQLV